jgi:homogentisate 1,2-dioxygenase
MRQRYFYSADGELLFVPLDGKMLIWTELGKLHIEPGEIAVIPRGIKFKADPINDIATGYLCENYGAPLILPERGPAGANGFANQRDFMYPVADFEDISAPTELIAKFSGELYRAEMDHSPLNVVGWVGNSAPYKYDLSLFNAMNTVSFDHPDPSIFTVLTSPSEMPGVANLDFVIFPPRWSVAEHTFRPPWFHRNVMSEFMGLVKGQYDAKKAGFEPGGMSLHNSMTPHGPEREVFERASSRDLAPEKVENTLAFMFESRYAFVPTKAAMESPCLQPDYDQCWAGLAPKFRR